MFEPQADVLQRYQSAGIRVGKVQVSSAIIVPADRPDDSAAWQQLAAFAEDRYLHQTMHRHPNGDLQFFEDLPAALPCVESADRTVPISRPPSRISVNR